ncbi:acetyltransferase domain-containing protein [Biscogniauxia marginata]|nr:acetyltransferase domain-containing protein [Biscogniauxia marginata]
MATIDVQEPGPPSAAAAAAAESKHVRVRTTLPTQPLPPNSARAPIRTPRLILRAFVPSDLEGVHTLRSQPEVMVFTSVGRVDRDRAETREFMDRFLPPNDSHTYDFVICLAETGEIIGTGGMHKVNFEFGWPEVGYMFKRECWGRGFATEFLRAWLEAWWALPRSVVDVNVDTASIGRDGSGDSGVVEEVPELVSAMVEENNPNSAKVLKKLGFREFKTWSTHDEREGYEEQAVTLIGLVLRSPGR